MTKYKLAACVIHNPLIHGSDYTSDPNISNHFLIDTLFDSEDFFDEFGFIGIQSYLNFLKMCIQREHRVHPTIQNYSQIIYDNKYIKCEIVEEDRLEGEESVGYIKTFWLKIVQRKWKKVFSERKEILKKRGSLRALHYRENHGKWPKDCQTYPKFRLF